MKTVKYSIAIYLLYTPFALVFADTEPPKVSQPAAPKSVAYLSLVFNFGPSSRNLYYYPTDIEGKSALEANSYGNASNISSIKEVGMSLALFPLSRTNILPDLGVDVSYSFRPLTINYGKDTCARMLQEYNCSEPYIYETGTVRSSIGGLYRISSVDFNTYRLIFISGAGFHHSNSSAIKNEGVVLLKQLDINKSEVSTLSLYLKGAVFFEAPIASAFKFFGGLGFEYRNASTEFGQNGNTKIFHDWAISLSLGLSI